MKTPTPYPQDQLIVFYDGVCHLYNRSVQFIIRHDNKNKFVFASLQSAVAQKRLREIHFKNSLETIVLLKRSTHFERSDAVLEIVKNLSRAWPLLYALKIVPRFLRDVLYSIIAKNRFRWFGKSEVCMVQRQEMIGRSLE